MIYHQGLLKPIKTFTYSNYNKFVYLSHKWIENFLENITVWINLKKGDKSIVGSRTASSQTSPL